MSIFKQGHGQVLGLVVVCLKGEIRGADLESLITLPFPRKYSVSLYAAGSMEKRCFFFFFSFLPPPHETHDLYEKSLKHIHVPSAVVCDDIKAIM